MRYADLLGKGRFGWVIDASYRGEKVVVQALNEAAGPDEQRRFLQQALKQRTMGEHVNVVSLLGVALDSPPFLSVLKSGDDDAGDLKTFLLNAGGKLIFNDKGRQNTLL